MANQDQKNRNRAVIAQELDMARLRLKQAQRKLTEAASGISRDSASGAWTEVDDAKAEVEKLEDYERQNNKELLEKKD